jgi:uncharacterized protein YndB with AHSA1/START domain
MSVLRGNHPFAVINQVSDTETERQMTRISQSVVIAAAAADVWAYVSDLASHPEWMRDAVAIRFVSDARTGTGVVMDCDTRVGPFRLTDRLVVTEWEELRVIAIRHQGAVTGTGRFVLASAGNGSTRFTWTEELSFPWWMGGPVGAAIARPVLATTWRRYLAGLRLIVEKRQNG